MANAVNRSPQEHDQPGRQAEVHAVALDRAVEIVTGAQDVGHCAGEEVHRVADQRQRGQVDDHRKHNGRHQRPPLAIQQWQQQQGTEKWFEDQRQPDRQAGPPLMADFAVQQPPQEQHFQQQNAAVDIGEHQRVGHGLGAEHRQQQGGRRHRGQRVVEQPQQQVPGNQDGHGVDQDEQVARWREGQVPERRHQQRAAGRVQIVRVDVVEVLVVECPRRAGSSTPPGRPA